MLVFFISKRQVSRIFLFLFPFLQPRTSPLDSSMAGTSNVPFSGKKKRAILLTNTMVFISHHPLNAVSNIMADTLELSWPLIWWRKFFLPWDQSQCIRSQRADQLSEHFPLSSLLRSDVQTNLALSGARGEGGWSNSSLFFFLCQVYCTLTNVIL